MVRATSLAAHRELRETKQLARRKLQVFNYIAAHPGCTRVEISRAVPDLTINCVSGRVRELLDAGLLYEEGCKKDRITGQSANCLFVSEADGAA